MSLETQFVTLLMMMGSGAALGVLFDVYRVLSKHLHAPRWLIPLLDFIYWLIATILVFRALASSNHGQVRLYVFLGLLAGLWLYFLVASRWVIRLVLLCIRVVRQLIVLIKRTVELVVIKPMIALYRLIIVIFGFLTALSIFLYKIVIQLCYPFWVLIRKLIRPFQKRFRVPAWLKPAWLTKLWNKIIRTVRRFF